MKIGHKLRAKRDFKRLSQQEVAALLDVSQRTYSNFESDKSEPSLMQLARLAEILEFNLLELLKEQGLVFNQPNSEFKDFSGNIVVNNNDSEELIVQYKAQIENLKTINKLLQDKINYLEGNKFS